MKNRFKILADERVADDLKKAIEFLESKKFGLSRQFIKDYKLAIKKLKLNPFYQVRYKQIHCLPLEKFRYMIHFKIIESENIVQIFAVISTDKDPSKNGL